MKNFLIKISIKSFIESTLLFIICEFMVSVFFLNQPIEVCFVVSILGAFFSSLVYFLLFIKESNNKVFTIATILSVLLTFIIHVIYFILLICGYLNIFPTRETNSADGLLILISVNTYVLFIMAFNTIVFLFIFIRNFIKKARNNKGNN